MAKRKEPARWVFLPGTPLSPQVWAAVVASLPAGHEALCPALPPPPPGLVNVQAELARQILDQTRRVWSGRFHVVGHSFGGQVAVEVALAAPELVVGVTVVCSRTSPYPAFVEAATALRASYPVDQESTLSRWFTPDEVAAGGPVVTYARGCIRSADRVGWASCLDAIAGYDRSDMLGELSMPVGLIAAELDQVSDPVTMAAMAGQMPDARLHVLPGAAHLSPFLDPAGLAGLIARDAVGD